MNDKEDTVKYDSYGSCKKCGGVNKTRVADQIDNIVCEVETECNECGHEDYWAYGFYDNGQ